MSQTQLPRGFVGKGSAATLTGQGAKILLQLASTAVLGRLLVPADFGLMGMVAPLLTFFVIFRDLGLSSVAIQRSSLSSLDTTNLFWINLGAGCILAVVVAALGPASAAFFNDDRLTFVVVLLSATFIVNGASAQYFASLQRNFRILRLVFIDVTATALGIASGVAAAWSGLGYWSLAIVPIVTQSVSLILAVANSNWQPGRPHFDRQVLGMLHTGAGFAGFNIFNFLSRNLDNILVGRFLGETALGYYSRAYNLMLVPLSQVTNPLAQVMVPALSRLAQNPDSYRATYLGAVQKVMFFCCPVIMGSVVGADWVVGLLLGPKWAGSVELLMVLGVSALVQPVGNSTGWLFISQGRSRDMLAWGVFSSLVIVASFVIGLRWGVLGLACSYTAAMILVTTPALCYWAGRRGPVSSRDLAVTIVPFLMVSGLTGWFFALARHYWAPPPAIGLIAVLGWQFASQTAIFLLHPATRLIVRDIGSTTRVFVQRRLLVS